MKGYISYFKIRVKASLQYRTAAWAGVATQFFWGFLNIMVYEAFYAGGSAEITITLGQLATYVWLRQAFLRLITIWSLDSDIMEMIKNGNVAYELARPYKLYNLWAVKIAANKLADTALRCAPIIVVGMLLPAPYGMGLPVSLEAFALFVLTMSLGLIITVATCMFIYIFTFRYLDSTGPASIMFTLHDLLSGQLIPLPLMPEAVRKVIYLTPFWLTSDMPFRIYSGNIAVSEALSGIGMQVVWGIMLIWLGKWAMKRIFRTIVVQGG